MHVGVWPEPKDPPQVSRILCKTVKTNNRGCQYVSPFSLLRPLNIASLFIYVVY